MEARHRPDVAPSLAASRRMSFTIKAMGNASPNDWTTLASWYVTFSTLPSRRQKVSSSDCIALRLREIDFFDYLLIFHIHSTINGDSATGMVKFLAAFVLANKSDEHGGADGVSIVVAKDSAIESARSPHFCGCDKFLGFFPRRTEDGACREHAIKDSADTLLPCAWDGAAYFRANLVKLPALQRRDFSEESKAFYVDVFGYAIEIPEEEVDDSAMLRGFFVVVEDAAGRARGVAGDGSLHWGCRDEAVARDINKLLWREAYERDARNVKLVWRRGGE